MSSTYTVTVVAALVVEVTALSADGVSSASSGWAGRSADDISGTPPVAADAAMAVPAVAVTAMAVAMVVRRSTVAPQG
ncbi:MAG: hypothetical protein R2705_10145 [Ilumatobacteraceae bacterium]